MGKYRSRPRMRIRNLKIRCFEDGCKVLAVRFVDVQPRMWYCKDHFPKEKVDESTRTSSSLIPN
jgi:hypothetical protein